MAHQILGLRGWVTTADSRCEPPYGFLLCNSADELDSGMPIGSAPSETSCANQETEPKRQAAAMLLLR